MAFGLTRKKFEQTEGGIGWETTEGSLRDI